MSTFEQSRSRGGSRFLAIMILLSLTGVASLALAPLDGVAPPDIDPQLFRWLVLIQPAVLAVIATMMGCYFAPRVGLDAPVLRALATGGAMKAALAQQRCPALIGGLFAGGILIVFSLIKATPTFDLPLITKLLYGGVTEELIARWGVMSFFMRLASRFRREGSERRAHDFWIGNTLAALLFSAAHLPLLIALSTQLSAVVFATVFLGNTAPALIFGWLFYRRGLEAAIIAHASAHLITVSFFAIATIDF
jgi:membrane protease YdiL (CAAX protease family)